MKKERKNYTPQEKVAILRRHLIEKEPVSDICEKLELQPTVFYRWLKEFFEHGAAAFEHRSNGNSKKHRDKQEARIAKLEQKLQTKNEVLAELMGRARHFKKNVWGDLNQQWVAHDIRDQIVDFVRRWSERTGIAVRWVHRMAKDGGQQVLRLESALRQGERAQCLGFLATIGWRIGRRNRSGTSTRRIPWKAIGA